MRDDPSLTTHRTDIDGLRAIAVLLVIVHHVAPTLAPGGFVGVDVFFVISGFLMTRIIDDAVHAGTFRYVDFIWRRCRRIVPALAVVIAATCLLGLCLLTGPELVSLARHVAAGSLSASNVLLWSEVGYFDTTAALKPLLHLWSLGIEEQFYLVWPLLLMLLPLQRRLRLMTVVAIVAGSLLVSENLAYSDPAQAFYLLHSRAWELGAGAILALAPPMIATSAVGLPRWWPRLRAIASVVGIGMIVGAAVATTGTAAWPGITALTPVLGTVLIIAAGGGALVNRTVLSLPAARWIGQRSYALYLWHWPPLAFLHILALERGWSAAVVGWAAVLLMVPVVLLAHLTLQFVERPARTRAERVTAAGPVRALHLRAYAAPLGVLVAMAAVLIQTHGLPGRYGTSSGDAMATLRAASPDSITTYASVASRCRLPDAGYATWCWRIAGEGAGIAVFGDSHAEVLFAGLAALRTGEPLFLTGRKGCAPIVQPTPIAERTAEICRRASNLAHETIRTDASIGTVLLTARGPAYISGIGFGIDSQRPVVPVSLGDSLQLRAAYEAGMERSIRALLTAGKRVILVLDTPELGFLPEECLIGRPFGLRALRTPCAVKSRSIAHRNAEYRALVARLTQRIPRLEVFDTAPILCDAAMCPAIRGGRLLYSDANHLTLSGSLLIAQQLRPILRPNATLAAVSRR